MIGGMGIPTIPPIPIWFWAKIRPDLRDGCARATKTTTTNGEFVAYFVQGGGETTDKKVQSAKCSVKDKNRD